ncbi:MAG: hypothetical protein V3V19_11170 [Cocleimonas sp.]
MEKYKIKKIETSIRYYKILLDKQKNILEIGFTNEKELDQFYFLCHSCKDGLRSNQGHDNIIIQAIGHMASENHMILLSKGD